MKNEYPPDRVAAILRAAIGFGLAFLTLLQVIRSLGDPMLKHWYWTHWPDVGFYFAEALFGIWLCAGVYGGRRWALSGMALESLVLTIQDMFRSPQPGMIVSIGMLGYCLLRLTAILGPRSASPPAPPSFLPDHIAACACAAINGFVFMGYVLGLRATPTPLAPLNYALLVASLSCTLWFSLGLYQSRRWSVVIGFLATLIGVFVLRRQPTDRSYELFNALFLLYLAARGLGFGPKVEAFAAHRSE